MSNKVINETNWLPFLKEYTLRNEDRPTRLGVFEKHDDKTNDLWIEDGLPLIAIDAYPNRGAMRLDIVLDKYTHAIDGVASIVDMAIDGVDQGLDISDTQGRTTILRFEDWPTRKEE